MTTVYLLWEDFSINDEADVKAAFTNKADAEELAKELDDGGVTAVDIHTTIPPKKTIYYRNAQWKAGEIMPIQDKRTEVSRWSPLDPHVPQSSTPYASPTAIGLRDTLAVYGLDETEVIKLYEKLVIERINHRYGL